MLNLINIKNPFILIAPFQKTLFNSNKKYNDLNPSMPIKQTSLKDKFLKSKNQT